MATYRVKPAVALSLRRRNLLMVQAPPRIVPLFSLCRRKRLPAFVANKPRWSVESKPFPLPFLHLGNEDIVGEIHMVS